MKRSIRDWAICPAPRQRGAALLTAMLLVTLVAALSGAALWRQWQAVEVERSERHRVQAQWILTGALDWSRLILREDTRGADHLAEPWAIPLEEARLSMFLAADRNVVDDDTGLDSLEAFLSGNVTDQQSRLNLTNLLREDGQVVSSTYLQWERLFEQLGLENDTLVQLVQGWQYANRAEANAEAPLLPRTLAQLAWLGIAPDTLQILQPHITILPQRTPVNLNTANAQVLMAAIDGMDMAGAMQFIASRQRQHLRTLADARQWLGDRVVLRDADHSVHSAYFLVEGRLRLDGRIVQEQSLIVRQGLQVRVAWRERGIESRPSAPTMAY